MAKSLYYVSIIQLFEALVYRSLLLQTKETLAAYFIFFANFKTCLEAALVHFLTLLGPDLNSSRRALINKRKKDSEDFSNYKINLFLRNISVCEPIFSEELGVLV